MNSIQNLATAVSSCKMNGRAVDCDQLLSYFGISESFVFFFFLFLAAFLIALLVANWKLYTKAGKPGWASLVPIYNMIVMLQIIGRPLWWLVLFFVPFANVIIALIMVDDLSRVFGKGIGFSIGLLFLPIIFIPILAFGKAEYRHP